MRFFIVWVICGIISCIVFAREIGQLDLSDVFVFMLGGPIGLLTQVIVGMNFTIWKRK